MTTETSIGGVTIRPARGDDWLAIESLLMEAHLPLVGAQAALPHFLVAEGAGATLLGCAALEHYPVEDGEASGLLRSVAVAPAARGLGLGVALVEAALRAAREARLADVTLLTTTATEFFPRFGFRAIARDAAPQAVRPSVEFGGACPVSATVMSLEL